MRRKKVEKERKRTLLIKQEMEREYNNEREMIKRPLLKRMLLTVTFCLKGGMVNISRTSCNEHQIRAPSVARVDNHRYHWHGAGNDVMIEHRRLCRPAALRQPPVGGTGTRDCSIPGTCNTFFCTPSRLALGPQPTS
jgi:hypothetical protein